MRYINLSQRILTAQIHRGIYAMLVIEKQSGKSEERLTRNRGRIGAAWRMEHAIAVIAATMLCTLERNEQRRAGDSP